MRVPFFLLLNWLYNIELKYGHNNELKREVLGRTDRLPTFLRYDTDRKENDASNNCYLAMIGGYTHRPTDTRVQ
jgi:hypothetical protein